MRLLRDTRRRYCCGSVKHDSVDVFTVKPSAVINTEDVGPKYYEFVSKELFFLGHHVVAWQPIPRQ